MVRKDTVRRDYEGEGITVHWDSARCIHTGICLRALPSVFDVGARPWINLEGAGAAAVADAVSRCPTGALTFTSESVRERAPEITTMRPVRGGPMLVRGDVRIVDADGNTICHETRVTLCRCGQSGNQPFCDNSHRRRGFEEPEPAGTPPAVAAPDEVCPPQAFDAEG